MSMCKCGSYAINHHAHGRDGSDGDLCDVCYWRKRAASAIHTVTVKLTDDDLKMIRAFTAWAASHPTSSPKKYQIERGHGEYAFPRYQRAANPRAPAKADTTGPNAFKRLVALGVIEHSRNGHCWLTSQGKRVADELTKVAA